MRSHHPNEMHEMLHSEDPAKSETVCEVHT